MLLRADPHVAIAPLAEFAKLLDFWMSVLDVILEW
jgi:hypothetical protein